MLQFYLQKIQNHGIMQNKKEKNECVYQKGHYSGSEWKVNLPLVLWTVPFSLSIPSSPVPTSLLDSNPNTHIHSTTQSPEYIHHKPFLFSFLPLKAEFTEISIYCHSPLPYFTFLFQPSPTHFLTPLKLLLSKGWLVYYKENRIISGRLGLGEKNQCL